MQDVSTHVYRSYMRPYRDRPDVRVIGRWWWCPPGAIALPFAHAFGSQYSDTFREEFVDFPIGEQRGWEGPNFATANPSYTGQHWCGTIEDWQQGAIYGQAQPVDPDGVPWCCSALPIRPGGGLAQGSATACSTSSAVWWLRPAALAHYADGALAPSWSDLTGNNPALQLGTGSQPNKGTDSDSGLAFLAFGHTDSMNALAPLSLGECTYYFIAQAIQLANVGGPAILGGGELTPHSFLAWIAELRAASNADSITYGQSLSEVPLTCWTLTRSFSSGYTLRINNEVVQTASVDPAGVYQITGIGAYWPPGPTHGAVALYELLVFPAALDQGCNDSIYSAITAKYPLPRYMAGTAGQHEGTLSAFTTNAAGSFTLASTAGQHEGTHSVSYIGLAIDSTAGQTEGVLSSFIWVAAMISIGDIVSSGVPGSLLFVSNASPAALDQDPNNLWYDPDGSYSNATNKGVGVPNVLYVGPPVTSANDGIVAIWDASAGSWFTLQPDSGVLLLGGGLNAATTIDCVGLTSNTVLVQQNAGLEFNSQVSAPGTHAGTLTTAPSAGNPTFWLSVTINGVVRKIPCW